MTSAHDYAQANAGRFREQLNDLLRIPSVSTDPEFAAEVRRAADWLAEDMRRIGLSVEIIPTAGHPMVYGEWMGAGSDAPTVLIYGHYDVQPAVMEDGWDSDPFEPVERDGKIYARGATDDKGQVFVHVKAAESLLAAEGSMPVNVKLIVEGEEESGSAGITQFVIDHPEKLSADVCLVSDTSILAVDQPSIIYALRGLLAMELHVTGPDHDLHSGTFGGSVHNPVQAAAEIVAKLHDADGRIAVPGFYDDVLLISDQERAELEKVPWTDADWKAATGAPQSWGEPGFSLRERTGARPTLEINGMAGGYYGAGFKTVLPAKAVAKISCRLVFNQEPQHIYELIRDYIRTITPPTITAELKFLGGGPGAFVDITTPAMQAAIKAYEQGWGKPPVFMREGGSIPIVAEFQNRLGAPVILMGFGLATDNLHGPNEHFTIEMFHKGIDTSIYFLKAVASLKSQQ